MGFIVMHFNSRGSSILLFAFEASLHVTAVSLSATIIGRNQLVSL